METRHVVAYALLALIAVGAAVLAWHLATRMSRRRRHERTMRERWLGIQPPPGPPLPGDQPRFPSTLNPISGAPIPVTPTQKG